MSLVLLRGADHNAFSAGANISEFQALHSNSIANREYSAAIHKAVMGLKNLPKPTIAMSSGFCVGGGTEIAVACDLRFASITARMGITPVKLGFIYDVAETKMLVDLIGPSHAKDILFSARLLAAEEAYQIGLVNQLYPENQLEEETFKYIRLLLANDRNSLSGAKTIINSLTSGVDVGDPALKEIVSDALDSPQYKEGVHAFLEMLKPNFLRKHS